MPFKSLKCYFTLFSKRIITLLACERDSLARGIYNSPVSDKIEPRDQSMYRRRFRWPSRLKAEPLRTYYAASSRDDDSFVQGVLAEPFFANGLTSKKLILWCDTK